MNRLMFNRAIVNKLSELVERYPDFRFGQLLVNCDIIQYKPSVLLDGQYEDILTIDPFYEESEYIWERMTRNKLCFKQDK